MEILFVLAAALVPVFFLFRYVNKKDSARPEPRIQVVLAFVLGVMSAFLAFMLSWFLGEFEFYSDSVVSMFDAFRVSLFGAALPEEVAKFFFFWLLVRKNKYFDERMDGIVYASCVSLGFAAIENVLYLMNNYDSWVSVGIARALFSVPGHLYFGVFMGYYYSLVHFSNNPSRFNVAMVLVAPIFAHTVFDTILFSMNENVVLSIVLVISFFILCVLMRKRALDKMKTLLEDDDRCFELQQNGVVDETLYPSQSDSLSTDSENQTPRT